MKKLYLATVCFLPIAMVPLFFAVFLRYMVFPVIGFPILEAYFLIGFIVLLVDLWRSSESSGTKVLWTVLNLTVGLVALPVYWIVVVRRKTPNRPAPAQRLDHR